MCKKTSAENLDELSIVHSQLNLLLVSFKIGLQTLTIMEERDGALQFSKTSEEKCRTHFSLQPFVSLHNNGGNICCICSATIIFRTGSEFLA